VREALATFLERNDVKGCKVAIAVPGQAGLVKFIKLPPVEKKRIPDIVKFEARQQIPFALEEVIWDYQQIGGDEEGGGEEEFTMAEVGLFAMKRDQINRAILPFTVAGIEVDIVQMGPIALYNYLTFDRLKGSPEKGAVVLLDIGADNTDLIISDGVRIWQRNVPIGGNHFTRALTKELKLTFAKAEHLKRNATKAPDPRSVFTAMRSVFNDLASEINRSIGFYSSVNRSTKILRVLGMGNGFKLPGLQKFLQQNLTHEVERLEGYNRLVGEDVVGAPQFQENLPSFAVAYGLALQGLGASQLETNLLPPEIEQVRMIRGKKPWALAASVLLMLAFSALFMGDWKLWAKVHNPVLIEAAKQATEVATRGAGFKSAYEGAKTEWNGQKAVGDSLVVDNAEQSKWPAFLKTLNQYIFNPVREFNLDPSDHTQQATIDKLRVHVDAIIPRWRNDLGPGWFDLLTDKEKTFIHPYDREHPPTEKGWVIQIIGHHYNPSPATLKKADKYDMGPLDFLARVVLPRLNNPNLRSSGVSHATLTWFERNPTWTSEMEMASNGMPANVPLLARDQPKAAEGGGAAGDAGYGGMAGQMRAQSGGATALGGGGGRMMFSGDGGGASAGYGSGGYGGGSMPGMPGGYGSGGFAGSGDTEKKGTTVTRTEFMIQLVWKPLKPGDTPRDIKEIQEELDKKQKETKGSVAMPTEKELEDASRLATEQARLALEKKMQEATKAASGTSTPAGPAAGAPAPGATTPAGAAPGASAPAPGPAAAPAPAAKKG
ncbi:MAG TPA: type IV pilus assembly protein PilM, partial [Isosphaeraceae bacterium]|nr:type IV pilus assembly protein PilM [Isosphaeraceae bacterium]